jgi:integrase/recombinase XerD
LPKKKGLRKPPSALALTDLDASLLSTFLDDLEQNGSVIARIRNLRLTAIRSVSIRIGTFYRFF